MIKMKISFKLINHGYYKRYLHREECVLLGLLRFLTLKDSGKICLRVLLHYASTFCCPGTIVVTMDGLWGGSFLCFQELKVFFLKTVRSYIKRMIFCSNNGNPIYFLVRLGRVCVLLHVFFK